MTDEEPDMGRLRQTEAEMDFHHAIHDWEEAAVVLYLGPDGVEPPAADHEAYLTACIRLWSTAERMVADVGAYTGAANTRA